jgi:ferric-dicitrate binding protein FerR (iron transport regulator)
MSLPKERIYYLLEAYTSNKATAQEEQELLDWMQDEQDDIEFKAFIQQIWDNPPAHHNDQVDWNHVFEQIVRSDNVVPISPVNRHIGWWKIAAAVIIIMALSFGIYQLAIPDRTDASLVKNEVLQPTGDIAAPASNKATLTLANGKVIILDHTSDGSLAEVGIANASKLNDGTIAYSANATPSVEFHTLQVPRGSKPMHLQLPDGSDVWLNAASSISFPNSFTGDERMVRVTGETYFEVKHDPSKPFIVSKDEMHVKVLGTKFNINAYDDESDLRVTLLDGQVNVTKGNREETLQPSQQARLAGSDIRVFNHINTGEVMAWKNGLFEFNETDIQTIMRQIARWYNVDVEFNGIVTQHFNGSIQRQVNVSKVLNMLEKTGGIRFMIEGKKVIVKKS